MPLQSEEVLKRLVEAAEEAQATVRALHEARGAALDVLKSQKKAISEAIDQAVSAAVGSISDEARDRMRKAADEIILSFERDWRAALRLDS